MAPRVSAAPLKAVAVPKEPKPTSGRRRSTSAPPGPIAGPRGTGCAGRPRSLERVGAGNYRLVRTTAYVKPGTSTGTQGGRLLYDTKRYRLVSTCQETTGSSNYHASCSIPLPILSSDGANRRRHGAYAEFEDKQTGRNFYRRRAALGSGLDRVPQGQDLNNHGHPIIVAGDINSWHTKRASHAPHNFLTSQGFEDAVMAKSRIDDRYPTVNHWKHTLKPTVRVARWVSTWSWSRARRASSTTRT
jgi:hypothetical protein